MGRGGRGGVAGALALAALCGLCAPEAARAQDPPRRDRGEKRICPIGQTIVLLREGVDPDEAARTFARRYEGVVCRVYRHSIRGVTLRCTGPRVVSLLAKDPLVRSTEPDVTVFALEQTVPAGVSRMGAADAVRSGGGPGKRFPVGVAVLDTGIDLSHPDLDVAGGVSFVDGSPSALDGQGHGTHVAGIIAARDDDQGVVGVAPGARLYAVKVLDDDGAGSLSDVIAGLDWVAKNADRIAVANLSLGVKGESPALRAAIQAAVKAGIVVVAAAGNDGADVFGEDGVFGTSDDRIPAAFPEVCAVSAIADSDGARGGAGPDLKYGRDDGFASFSNHSARAHEDPFVRSPGGAIDLAAPGTDILSCWKDGGYRRASGTSMAAPHVTGLFARLIAARGRDLAGDGKIDERDVYALRQALVDSAEAQVLWRPDGTGDPDALREGLASAGRAPVRRPPPPTDPPPLVGPAPGPSPAPGAGHASLSVIGIVAPASRLEPSERAGVLVGVRNRGPIAAAFDLVLVDIDAGRGIGRYRVQSLAAGAALTVTFPCDGRTFDPAHELKAVILAPSPPATAASLGLTPAPVKR